MVESHNKEKDTTMTEYESERERMAAAMDIIMRIREAKANGKEQYSSDEVVEFIYDYVADIKQHK